MSIELIRFRERKMIAWLREEPPNDARRVFEERGYVVERCDDAKLEDKAYLCGLCAVVLTQTEQKPLQIVRALQAHALRLLDFDCRIVLYSVPVNGGSILTNAIPSLEIEIVGLPTTDGALDKLGNPPLPYVHYFEASTPWSRIANFISESSPGPAPNLALNPTVDPVVDSDGRRQVQQLPASSKVLLQRAFADCAKLHLTPLDGGRSGVRVYRGCAELNGLHGRWPQPYFVKIGDKGKILSEYENYETRVDPYVPFHLGPHLIRERCCLGGSEGVIVGDYVEESESLRYCAQDGRSASAIACLFDRTLLGWHRSARKLTTSSLSAALLRHFPGSLDTTRMERARELGARKTPKELRKLFLRCTSKPVLVGPIHGDLHSANVRVRATDAVVIDFLAHRDAPLLFDAAVLEASLLVEGFSDRQDAQERWVEKWVASLKPLYDGSPLAVTDQYANPRSQSSWFHACAQQIRRYARQWDCGGNQYAAALALALLVKAAKDPRVAEPEASRRAVAYVLAERLLVNNFGKNHSKNAAKFRPVKGRPSARAKRIDTRKSASS